MALYELIVLGSPSADQIKALEARAHAVAEDFDLAMPDGLALRTASDAGGRDPKAAAAALFFGGDPAVDEALVARLLAERVPIIPVVAAGQAVERSVPASIAATNACFLPASDGGLEILTAVAFEALGLLRQQRRVFVSYRRTESRKVAVQLHDRLSARGFDVFLDTHDIRPGEPFQEMLWHRLADCDAVIVLDTDDYFGSKWTTQEFGRTLAKGIHVLRFAWEKSSTSPHLTLGESVMLRPSDFGSDGGLEDRVIDDAVVRLERIRSRSIATRHREMAGKLRIEVERIGGKFDGIGLHRAMAFTLPGGRRIVAYPTIGVPTSDLLDDIHRKTLEADAGGMPCLVYDHVGIRDRWLGHLGWLGQHIAAVRTLRVLDAGWELVGWDV